MTPPRLILLFAVLHAAKPQHVTNQSNNYPNYEKVSLMEPKFKSKQLAGLGWYNQPSLESGAGHQRHLEWLESSGSDSESAEPTEKGFFAQLLEEEDDDDENTSSIAPKEDKINSGNFNSKLQKIQN